MLKIATSKAATKGLTAMPPRPRAALRQKLDTFAADPQGAHPWAKPLVGRRAVRIRQGDWRALCEIDHERQTLVVVAVEHRREVYR